MRRPLADWPCPVGNQRSIKVLLSLSGIHLCRCTVHRVQAQVSGRRLQSHGGTVHEKRGLLQTPLPAWLSRLTRRLAADTAVYGVAADGGPKQPNHVLINAYTAGQGIMVRTACDTKQHMKLRPMQLHRQSGTQQHAMV